jgi:hypothetical protein
MAAAAVVVVATPTLMPTLLCGASCSHKKYSGDKNYFKF